MTTAVEDHRLPLPHAHGANSASSPAELPSFTFPAAPSAPKPATTTTTTTTAAAEDTSSQQTPTQASFDSASVKRHAPSRSTATASAATSEHAADQHVVSTAPSRTYGHRHTSSLDSLDAPIDEDEQDSDNESAGSDSRPSKKKKSQRFYCTQYPPCNLSFTRSEHLARHIRKHTGERPFQCHCLRRFSRLDNLRQHAQTVHVNEDIPCDSLAATGTRFQRQIRTERIRPQHRARASTLSAPGAHSRGHSRNMSNSSVGSVSDFGSPDDVRRRPPPLAMAQSPRHGLAIDTHAANNTSQGPEPAQQPYHAYSPSGYSTPVSVFSHEATSPVPSHLQSPISFAPARSAAAWDGRSIGHARRLSVPSQPSHTFLMTPASGPGPAYAAGPPQHHAAHHHPPAAAAPPHPPAFSPTGSSTAGGPGDAQISPTSPDPYLKRRTWHPSTISTTRPATSGLSYYQTPDKPQPVAATQPAAQQSIQLPGISSFFDRASHGQPAPRPRRQGSGHAMDIDEQSAVTDSDAESKRNSWASVNQHFDQMDITQAPSQRPVTAPYSATATTTTHHHHQQQPAPRAAGHLPTREPAPAIEPPTTPRKMRHQAWSGSAAEASGGAAAAVANAPASYLRTSPEGSSSISSADGIHTPTTGSLTEYQPAIVHHSDDAETNTAAHMVVDHSSKPTAAVASAAVTSQRYPGPHPPAPPPSQMHYQPPRPGAPMDRLDALVAVATQADNSLRRQI